ncbi:MAG: OadG family protein [Clostridium sp.]|nr:OadG family protein [Clostridium sp.]
MKMKKSLIVISMFAVMVSLSGCEDSKEAVFEYDDSQIVLDTMAYFDQYADVSGDYAKYYIENGTEFEQSAVKGIRQAIDTDKVGKLQDYSGILSNAQATGLFSPESADYKIVNNDDSVSVTIINRAENRDVEITVKYVENPEYFMEYDMASQYYTDDTIQAVIEQNGLTLDYLLMMYGCSDMEELKKTLIESDMEYAGLKPYEPEEMVVSAVYSKKELMASAGRNTIIGMGTVFVVLVFISFIISLFKFLPALFAPKPKLPQEEEKKPAAPVAAPKPVTAVSDNLINDAELVAVITAAIYAASADMGGSGAVSKDRLVVRSIRRAKR